MNLLQDDYNTQRHSLTNSELGRNVQEYMEHIQGLTDKAERTKWIIRLVQIIAHLNPELKKQNNYEEKIWGHLFQIADYSLDVDCPFPLPTREQHQAKPQHLGYNTQGIRFRFYGRNLQLMIDRVCDMEDGDLKQDTVNMIASFMFNSCKMWNNENLSNEVIADHLKILSNNKLVLDGDDLVVSQDKTIKPMRTPIQSMDPRKNFNKNKKKKFGNKPRRY